MNALNMRWTTIGSKVYGHAIMGVMVEFPETFKPGEFAFDISLTVWFGLN